MATTDELRSRIEKMTQQLQAMENRERGEALKTARELVKKFAFAAEELGIASASPSRAPGKKAAPQRVREERPALYLQPKTGATWNGWGKPPHWIPKDKAKRAKYLINQPVALAEAPAAPEVKKQPEKPAKKSGAVKTASAKTAPAKTTEAKPVVAKKVIAKKVAAKKVVAKKAVKSTSGNAAAQKAATKETAAMPVEAGAGGESAPA